MARPEIRILGDVDTEPVEKFLIEQGGDKRIIQWKYFDREFNRGRNRGFVAFHGGTPVGFVGLIPFRAAFAKNTIDTAWTCDWRIDETHKKSLVGISLLKQAIDSYPSVFHVGGNQTTQKIFSRLATIHDQAGVRVYRRLLRFGGMVRRAKVRWPWTRFLPTGLVEGLPLARMSKTEIDTETSVFDGVSPAIGSALAQQQFDSAFHPVHDAAYLEWQIGRCPDLRCFTITSTTGAAALTWCHKRDDSLWRLFTCLPPLDNELSARFLGAVIKFAFENGAESITTQSSRHDLPIRTALENCGFEETGRVPFFAFYRSPEDMPSNSMSGLSYVDVDQAYRY